VVKIPVMKNPVPIRDAEGEKFILLLALIFFGMIARYAGDWGLSKEVFPIRKPKITITVEDSKTTGSFHPAKYFKKNTPNPQFSLFTGPHPWCPVDRFSCPRSQL